MCVPSLRVIFVCVRVSCFLPVASELKGRGNYIARTLSYAGATFRTDQLRLTEEDEAAWDAAAVFWAGLLEAVREAARCDAGRVSL
eukprot:COSAG05_NODE_883_length_6777_cov_36.660081_5_plen_86_part_00